MSTRSLPPVREPSPLFEEAVGEDCYCQGTSRGVDYPHRLVTRIREEFEFPDSARARYHYYSDKRFIMCRCKKNPREVHSGDCSVPVSRRGCWINKGVYDRFIDITTRNDEIYRMNPSGSRAGHGLARGVT